MRRRLLAAVFICAFIVLAAYYDVNVTYHLNYPRENEVNPNYEAYVGRMVTISGRVVSTSAQSFELASDQNTYTIFSPKVVQPGDSVVVIGTLESGRQLHPASVYRSPWILQTLVYVRSFVALIFVTVLFLVSWRFDRRGWVIRPRKPVTQKQGGA